VATIRHKQDTDGNGGHSIDFVIDSPSSGSKEFKFKESGHTSQTFLTVSDTSTFSGEVTAVKYNVSNTSGYLVRENTGSGYGLFKSSTTNIGIASNGNVALDFDSSSNATFGGDVTAGGKLEVTHDTNFVGKFTNTATSMSNNNYTLMVDSSSHTSNMSAAGAMSVDVNSGRAFTITGQGKVGIGTTSPEVITHIFANDTSNKQLMIDQDSTGDAVMSFRLTGVSEYVMGIDNSDGDKFKIANSGTVGTATRLTIDSSGYVGINQTSPTRQLHILNSSGDNRGIMVENTVATSYAEVHIKAAREFRIGTGGSSSDSNSSDRFFIFDATASAHRFTIGSTGNVGIGVTSPSEKLEVNDGNIFINGENHGLIVDSVSKRVGFMKYNGHEAYISRVSGQDFAIVRTSGSDITDGSSLTTDLYVSSNGNVGISYTSPAYSLEIASNGSAGRARVYADGNGAIFSANGDLQFFTNNAVYAINWYSANKGAKIMALNNAGNLQVKDDVVAFASFSDKRLKKDIKPLTNNLNKICKLNPIEYKWRDNYRDGKTEIGLIAQEVEKIIPEVVRENKRIGDDTSYKQVDYEHLTATLIGAIQELKQEVEQLKKQIK